MKFADQTIRPESPAREDGPKAPLVSHSEQSQSLQSDIRDLVSMMGQLLKSGQRPGVSNSSDTRYDYRNYDRSPQRVNTFRQGSPTPPYRQRSPSPLPPGSPSASRRPGLSRGKDNTTFYRSPSPSFRQGTKSPSPTQEKKLNEKGSGTHAHA